MDDGCSEILRVAGSEDLPEGRLAAAQAGGVRLVLARVGGVVYALADRCVHLGCPLSRGTLSGHALTCPCHDWRFDLRTGKFLDAPEIAVQPFAVTESGGAVFVAVPRERR